MTATSSEHPLNRRLFIVDNLKLLERLNNAVVDLVCIDPPFAKNQTFTGKMNPELSVAEYQRELELLQSWGITDRRAARESGVEWPDNGQDLSFSDVFTWENDIHQAWLEKLEDDYPVAAQVVETARNAHSESHAAYLAYMAVRFIEIRRVLKPDGSFYVHCDHTANAYLRVLLDSIFGKGMYKGEISWKRTSAHKDSAWFGNVVDTILCYSGRISLNAEDMRVPLAPEYVEKNYKHNDDDGRGPYQSVVLTAAGTSDGESGRPWRGVDPGARSGRHWSAPKATGKKQYGDWIADNLIAGYESVTGVHDRLDALEAAGMIVWSRTGNPRLKRYLAADRGKLLSNLWTDIAPISSQSAEATGYPTQKPVELAERIITASTDEGDLVLDCFAGCAYVPVAAERLDRQWIGCDISPRALTVVRRQFHKFGLAVEEQWEDANGQLRYATAAGGNVEVRGPHHLPERDYARNPDLSSPAPRLQHRDFAAESDMPKSLVREKLLEWSDYQCWACGFVNVAQNRDGTFAIIHSGDFFELDHVIPKRLGGDEDIWNRALLCRTCNGRKGGRDITLNAFIDETFAEGRLRVEDASALPDYQNIQRRARGFWRDYTAARPRKEPHN